MIFLLIFIVIIVLFFIFGMKYITRERRISWSGEVVDKEQSEWTDDNNKTIIDYILKVRLDDGKMHEVSVAKEFYDEVKIGDKLKKDLGTSRPTKI
ncbi:MAG TPA: hypothetical protein P5225_01425 [Candidatus Paceibacterota bacterium]|nr:hypothetical protein [Candidatus Paceibacterota bacterium]